MAFEYEELTKLDKHNLPNLSQDPNVTGWYIDKSRNICITGSVLAVSWQELAEGGDYRWLFDININNHWFKVVLLKINYENNNTPNNNYVYIWDKLIEVEPKNLYEMPKEYFINILKEALSSWGGGYEKNQLNSNYTVEFNF